MEFRARGIHVVGLVRFMISDYTGFERFVPVNDAVIDRAVTLGDV